MMKALFTTAFRKNWLLLTVMMAGSLATPVARAAAPGITGGANNTFNLIAQPAFLTQPDGQAIYSWGYGCDPKNAPAGFAPSAIIGTFCNAMQVPGPTLVVTEGQTITVNLVNGLPAAAGNTSILF